MLSLPRSNTFSIWSCCNRFLFHLPLMTFGAKWNLIRRNAAWHNPRRLGHSWKRAETRHSGYLTSYTKLVSTTQMGPLLLRHLTLKSHSPNQHLKVAETQKSRYAVQGPSSECANAAKKKKNLENADYLSRMPLVLSVVCLHTIAIIFRLNNEHHNVYNVII